MAPGGVAAGRCGGANAGLTGALPSKLSCARMFEPHAHRQIASHAAGDTRDAAPRMSTNPLQLAAAGRVEVRIVGAHVGAVGIAQHTLAAVDAGAHLLAAVLIGVVLTDPFQRAPMDAIVR